MRKEHETCTMDGCDRPHKARGYCQTHYMQFKRGIMPVGPIKVRVRDKLPECTEEGCAEPVKAKGLCKMHYQRLLRHGHVRLNRRAKDIGTCSIPLCDGRAYAKSLCHAHYLKDLRWGRKGVDAARYQEMLHTQGGVCAICHQPETSPDKASGKTKDLAIDHDHATGAIRALLCSNCNRGLGLFNDSIELLAKAREYVLYHERSGIT
jgi:hypothetical protein